MQKLLLSLLLTIACVGNSLADNWWESVKVKGDLRYRHEMIDQEGKDARHRQRLRVRLGIEGKVNSEMKIGIQLATGSDDPVSTNQTLGDGFTTKNIGLDLGYFKYTPERYKGFSITGGKFKNPFFKPGHSELIWDSDFNPEGGVAVYDGEFENLTFFLLGSGLWVTERSSSEDSWLGAGQAYARYQFNKKTNIAFGGSYYNYVNSKGFMPFWNGEPMGNSTVQVVESIDGIDTTFSTVYANDFELLEAFVEFNHTISDIPVTVMGDLVSNTAADSLNTGWLIGLRLGKTKEPWSWALRYIYRKVEADAVVGTFTDSDFRGGGTDGKGHEFGGSLQLAKNTTFNFTYFINQIGLKSNDLDDFQRMQIDLQLKF